jgi:hypothetical protein
MRYLRRPSLFWCGRYIAGFGYHPATRLMKLLGDSHIQTNEDLINTAMDTENSRLAWGYDR